MTELYERFPFDRSLAHDPLSLVRPFRDDRKAAEIAGVFASVLAIGNTTSIRRAFADLVERCEGDLAEFVLETDPRKRSEALTGFRHRWIRGDQIAYLAERLRTTYDGVGSLEEVFLEGFQTPDGYAGGLAALSRSLRGPENDRRVPRGYRALFPSPLEAPRSPCKRLALFVRWMVRTEYPDLGLWRNVPISALRIPLDQHVYWIAYHLGLTARRTRNWTTVEEVTAALARVDPSDPIKFDFVLCHTGISGDCPKERDLSVCGACVVRPDCLLWRRPRGAR